MLRNQALVYIAIILTGVLTISVLYNTASIRFYRGQTTDMAGSVLRQGEATLEDKTEQFTHILELVYLNPKLQDLLLDEYYSEVPRLIAQTEIETYLAPMDQKLSDLLTEVSNTTFYVSNKTLGSVPGSIEQLDDARDEPWFKLAEQQKNDRMLWVVTAGKNGERLLSAVHPLRNLRISAFSGNFLGYVKMDFDIDQFFQNVLKAKDASSEWMLVTDADGQALASTLDHSLQEKAAALTGAKQADWRTVKLNGRNFLLSGTGVSGTTWTFWYAVSEVTLSQAGFRQVNLPVLLLTIAMTAAMAAAAWFTASRLARRIGRLAGAMGSLEQGMFDIRVEDRGGDEVAFLASGFNTMATRLDEHVRREYRDRMQQKEYDLQALQAQLHPHFLYNSLASISWLGVQSGSEDIPAISNALSRFYRLSLSRGRNIILVSDEADQARAYLDVMAIRYRGRINTLFKVSGEITDTWTLKLVLQPFVENAILHGLHVLKDHINLIVSAERDGDALVWKVIDDGVGMPAGQIPDLEDSGASPAGYGIANVHRRIRMYFGEEYGVKIASDEGIGTAVMIRMPLMREKPAAD